MFYDNYVRLCNSVCKSPSAVALEIGFKKSTVTRWKNGSNPTDATLQKIADYFGITVDALMGNEQKEKAPALTKKDERDISKKLQQTLDELENAQGGLMFDGQPLDDETKELLAISLKNSLEISKKIAKQKYTPKKYRKQNKPEGD